MEGEFVATTSTPMLRKILAPKDWLALSFPCSAEEVRTMESPEEKGPNRSSSSSSSSRGSCMGDGFVPLKKRKTTCDCDLSLSLSIPSSEEEGEERRCLMAIYNKKARQMMLDTARGEESRNNNDKKLRVTGKEKEWFEKLTRMDMADPIFCLSKRATNSDASTSQHRFQLRKSDIANASQPLKDLANAAEGNAVPVKVIDRECNEYDMVFKYLTSSNTYRFMGHGYTNFLSNSNLKENQIVNIWGLPRENQGTSRLAFIT